MEITAQLVKELREQTGVGIMECKKALVEANGNLEQAALLLRTSGKAKAAKKSSRIASEGVIAQAVSSDGLNGVLVELNCETDFVAKDAEFNQLAKLAANNILTSSFSDIASNDRMRDLLISEKGCTLIECIEQLVAKVGEKITLRRVAKLTAPDGGMVASYVHAGRIGALVSLDINDAALGKDLAMQVAASNPIALNQNDLDPQLIAKEKAIYLEQMQNTNKPAAILEQIVNGKVQKFVDEITLEGQIFIKDSKLHIRDLLAQHHAKALNMARLEVGEGIEKEAKDFASEVAAITGGSAS